MNYQSLSTWHTICHFFLYYLFSSNFCLICLLLFFFVKRSNSFLTIKIIENIYPRYSIFNFFNQKKFFWAFAKNLLYFDILWWSPTLNFRFLSLFSTSKSIYVLALLSRFSFLNCWINFYILVLQSCFHWPV